MAVIIRRIKEEDKIHSPVFTTRLVKFNQINHNKLYIHGDDCELVLKLILRKAEETFNNRNKASLVLIAENDCQPVGQG